MELIFPSIELVFPYLELIFFIIIKVIIPLLTWIFISGNFGSGLGNIPLIPGGDFASRGIPVGGNQGSSPYIHTITQSQSTGLTWEEGF